MYKSALAIASLAAAATAESSSCPATTTLTSSSDGPSRTYVWVTEPYATSLDIETTTETSWVVNGTRTTTYPDVAYQTICGQTTTEEVLATATSYTGDYTSSALPTSTSCAPYTSYIYQYDGTTTLTNTQFIYASYVTETVTSTSKDVSVVFSGSTTSTVSDDSCTSTSKITTGTASSTSTQALKCHPTNLIGTDGIAGQRGFRGAQEDGIANWGAVGGPVGRETTDEDGEGANKDASACCQACQDDKDCSASLFAGTSYTYPRARVPWCTLFSQSENQTEDQSEEKCGQAFTIFPGDKAFAQTGCGYIAENVYADGLCEEGQSPRDCQKNGIGRVLN